jgi:telomerase protein component 1
MKIPSSVEVATAKTSLLHCLSGSLIAEPDLPSLLPLLNKVAELDPEFILKITLYVRDDLGIRTLSHAISAWASLDNRTNPFLSK